MRGVGYRGSHAPCAAAGKVGSDPLPLWRGVLCVDLNGSVRLLGVLHGGQLVNPVQGDVVEHLGRVRAHGGLDGGLFGRRN